MAQAEPLLHYSWDTSLTLNMGNKSELSLSASGITAFPPMTECGRDGLCPKFISGVSFKLPSYKYGELAGLTMSMWIKPSNESGANARIFEMSNGAKTSTVAMYRDGSSSRLAFSVSRGGATKTFVTVEDKTFQANAWKHVAWTLGPTIGSLRQPSWSIYVDGNLTATVDGFYPEGVELDSSYIGRAAPAAAAAATGGGGETRRQAVASEGQFLGYMDSFMMYPEALSDNEVRLVYLVSGTMYACV